jgi:hypothetical protein
VIAVFLDMGSYNFRDGSVLLCLLVTLQPARAGHSPASNRSCAAPAGCPPPQSAKTNRMAGIKSRSRRTPPIITHRWPLDLVESLEGRENPWAFTRVGLGYVEWGSDTSNYNSGLPSTLAGSSSDVVLLRYRISGGTFSVLPLTGRVEHRQGISSRPRRCVSSEPDELAMVLDRRTANRCCCLLLPP